MFANQLGDSAVLHLIKTERTWHYRLYIAFCIIQQQLQGFLRAGTSPDDTPELSEPAGECLKKLQL